MLIIDEISMVSAEFFHMLEAMVKQVRGLDLPWGGLQLVACGDFFQLPPISQRPQQGLPKNAFLNRGHTFQAPAWLRSNMQVGGRPSWAVGGRAGWCCGGNGDFAVWQAAVGWRAGGRAVYAAAPRRQRLRPLVIALSLPHLTPPTPPLPQSVVLTRVWRQSDVQFAGVLNSIRFGDNAAAARLARDCSRPLPEREGIKPTQASWSGASCGCGGRGRAWF